MIKIIEVKGNKITTLINGEITVEFLKIKDRVVEISRSVETGRLSSQDLWIPPEVYRKLIRQVNAIFKSREKRSPP